MEIGGKMKRSLEEGTSFILKLEREVQNRWRSSGVTIGFSNQLSFSPEHGQICQLSRTVERLNPLQHDGIV